MDRSQTFRNSGIRLGGSVSWSRGVPPNGASRRRSWIPMMPGARLNSGAEPSKLLDIARAGGRIRCMWRCVWLASGLASACRMGPIGCVFCDGGGCIRSFGPRRGRSRGFDSTSGRGDFPGPTPPSPPCRRTPVAVPRCAWSQLSSECGIDAPRPRPGHSCRPWISWEEIAYAAPRRSRRLLRQNAHVRGRCVRPLRSVEGR